MVLPEHLQVLQVFTRYIYNYARARVERFFFNEKRKRFFEFWRLEANFALEAILSEFFLLVDG